MKVYHSPGTCSEGILMALKIGGIAHEVVPVPLAEGAQRRPEYLALNPKGKVPALQTPEGVIVTEYPVISLWLAEHHPEAALLPEGADRYAALSIVDYVVATLHMRGASFVFNPARFTATEAAHDELRGHGRAIVAEGFAYLSGLLGEKDWFFDRPGVAEAAVYYVAAWAERLGVPLPANLAALTARLQAL